MMEGALSLSQVDVIQFTTRNDVSTSFPQLSLYVHFKQFFHSRNDIQTFRTSFQPSVENAHHKCNYKRSPFASRWRQSSAPQQSHNLHRHRLKTSAFFTPNMETAQKSWTFLRTHWGSRCISFICYSAFLFKSSRAFSQVSTWPERFIFLPSSFHRWQERHWSRQKKLMSTRAHKWIERNEKADESTFCLLPSLLFAC